MALSRSIVLLTIALCCSQVFAQYQPKCRSTTMYVLDYNGDFRGNYGGQLLYYMAGTFNFSWIDVANINNTYYTTDVMPSYSNVDVATLNSIYANVQMRSLTGRIILLVSANLGVLNQGIYGGSPSGGTDNRAALTAAANRLKEINVEIFIVDPFTVGNWDPYSLNAGQGFASNPVQSHILFENDPNFQNHLLYSVGGATSSSFATIGDPYIFTLDGNSYSFNGLGEFTLYRGLDYIIQVRMAPCDNSNPSSRTCNRAIAIYSTGSGSPDTVELHYDPVAQYFTSYENGFVQTPYSAPSGVFYSWNSGYVQITKFDTPVDADPIFFAQLFMFSGQFIVAFGPQVGLAVIGDVALSNFGFTQGLVGTWDGCADNDYYSQNETYTAPSDSPRNIYNNFANTWRVSEAESLFTHGVNAQYYMPHYAEYSPQWNPAFSGVQPSANAPGDCAFFSDVSPFLYNACVDDVSKGNSAIIPIAYIFASLACADYCASGFMLESFVSESYCASTCALGNDLDFHTTYNATILPPFFLEQIETGATFSTPLGGAYTYSLVSDFCLTTAVTGTIQITCDQPPQVNAGVDRVSKKVSLYGWPNVALMASAGDQNTDALQYSWKLISYPTTPNYTLGTFPVRPPSIFGSLLNNAAGLAPYFQPLYPGDYVFEFSAFDGCFFAKDQVTVHAQCADCQLHIQATEIPDQTYQSSAANTDTYLPGSPSSNGYVFDYEYADYLDYQWFIDSNSQGYNWTYPALGNSVVYDFTVTPDEVVLYTNATGVTSVGELVVNTTGLSINTATIIRNEGQATLQTTTITNTTTITTSITYSSIPEPITMCSITIYNAASAQASFVNIVDYDANVSRPFTQQPSCIGDYTVRVAARDECQTAFDTVNLHLGCSEQPQAHLISCSKTIAFNYPARHFPAITFDGTDTFDPDTTLAHLLYQWEIQTPTGVTKYMGSTECSGHSQEAGTNAFMGCNTPTWTAADGAGTYTITMWVSDGCTYDYEATTVVAQCDPLSVNAFASTPITQDGVAPAYGVANLTASFNTQHPTSVANQWSLVNGPSGYLSMPNTPALLGGASTNATARLFLGGTYTYMYTANDGCTQASENVTVTYQCVDTLSWSATPDVSTLAFTSGAASWPSSVITIDLSNVNNNSSRAYYSYAITAGPVGTTQITSTGWIASPGGNPTYTFTPDIPGVYTVVAQVTDSCNYGTITFQITATCSVSVPAISGGSASYIIPSFGQTQITDFSVSNTFLTFGVLWRLYDSANNTYQIQTGLNPTITVTKAGNYFLVAEAAAITSFGVPICASAASAPVTFAVNCNYTLGISNPSQVSSTFVRGKFSRVTLTPSFTGLDPAYIPLSNSLRQYTWTFIDAPVGSVFAPTSSSLTTQTNSSTDSNYVYNGYTWTRTWTDTVTLHTTIKTTWVTLKHNDAFDVYDGCFAPDVSGAYTLEFSIVDYCGNVVTQQYQVAAACNAAPTASAGSAATYSFDGTGFINFGGSNKYTSIPLNASASDSDGDFLDYAWSIVSQPNNSAPVTVTNTRSLLASFVPTAVGVYVLQFSATDGCSTTSSNVTITVACPNTYTVNAPTSFTFDGFTPVALQEFSLVSNPQCTRLLGWQITSYNPATAIPPPASTTGEQHKSGSSQIAVPAFLIAFLALFVKML